MKKLVLLTFITVLLSVTVFSNVPVAARTSEETLYKDALKAVKKERTDVYALDYYKQNSWASEPLYANKAKEITKGLTSDYDKAKAIFDWVVANTIWDEKRIPFEKYEEYGYMQGTCVAFAAYTRTLCQAVGIPAKTVIGGAYSNYNNDWAGHEWNRVYVDNRWIHVDSTFGEFDTPVDEWSLTHECNLNMSRQDEAAWNGSLYFVDYYTGETLKEVKKFPCNGLVKETYGYDIKQLFTTKGGEVKQLKLNNVRITSGYAVILVKQTLSKTCKVTFKSNGGSKVKSVKTETGLPMLKVANPTRKGYKFVGWYKDAKLTKKFTFGIDLLVKDITLYAKWKKVK